MQNRALSVVCALLDGVRQQWVGHFRRQGRESVRETEVVICRTHGLFCLVVDVWQSAAYNVCRARLYSLPSLVWVVLVAAIRNQVHDVVGVGQHALYNLGARTVRKSLCGSPAGWQRAVLHLVNTVNAQFAVSMFSRPRRFRSGLCHGLQERGGFHLGLLEKFVVVGRRLAITITITTNFGAAGRSPQRWSR